MAAGRGGLDGKRFTSLVAKGGQRFPEPPQPPLPPQNLLYLSIPQEDRPSPEAHLEADMS